MAVTVRIVVFVAVSSCSLRVDINASEEHAVTIFRVKACSVRRQHSDYIGILQGMWSKTTPYFESFGLDMVSYL